MDIKKLQELPTVNTNYETECIARLLSIPAGEQIYRREIGILFNILELKSKPMFVTKN